MKNNPPKRLANNILKALGYSSKGYWCYFGLTYSNGKFRWSFQKNVSEYRYNFMLVYSNSGWILGIRDDLKSEDDSFIDAIEIISDDLQENVDYHILVNKL